MARGKLIRGRNLAGANSPAIVERTDLLASVPRRFAEKMARNFDIEIHQPPIPVAEQHIYLMWHRKNEHDAGHRWLREMLLATMREGARPAGRIAPPARPGGRKRSGNTGPPARPPSG
jgi:DNA-binding transcriptional LysR family regulator